MYSSMSFDSIVEKYANNICDFYVFTYVPCQECYFALCVTYFMFCYLLSKNKKLLLLNHSEKLNIESVIIKIKYYVIMFISFVQVYLKLHLYDLLIVLFDYV